MEDRHGGRPREWAVPGDLSIPHAMEFGTVRLADWPSLQEMQRLVG